MPDPPASKERARALRVDDPIFDEHALGGSRGGGYHPERPQRLVAARAGADRPGVAWRDVPVEEASLGALERVHTPRYLEALGELRGAQGQLDPDTYFAPASVEAAMRASGGVMAMVDGLIDTDVRRGVALVRPPGHHARPDAAMGFCLLNHVAVAAAHAVARGLSRVLVVDWDVHHGNGTEEMFWRRPDVLYASTHQSPFYPGTGAADDVGEGEGRGFTLNVPLRAGADDDVYREAFERVVLPAAEEYAPELVLVSAGFDASARDPLAGMRLSPDAFFWMARALAGLADRSAAGRIALVLEGGYDLVALEACLASAIDGLLPPAAEGGELHPPERPGADRGRGGDPDVEQAARSAKAFWKAVG